MEWCIIHKQNLGFGVSVMVNNKRLIANNSFIIVIK